jgi:hypothetical protein
MRTRRRPAPAAAISSTLSVSVPKPPTNGLIADARHVHVEICASIMCT